MAKHKHKTSPQTVDEAEAIAKATQKPGQSKEQTKLIAKGIQKGISEYKKRQKVKARELDKKLRKGRNASQNSDTVMEHQVVESNSNSKLPWILLTLSWLLFVTYLYVQ